MDSAKKLTIVKFVNGEVFYFPEEMYDVNVYDTTSKICVIHKGSNTVSLEADMSHVLYLRRNIHVKNYKNYSNEETHAE